MTRIVSIDGSLRPPAEATVSVYDRGFLYGDSVFETVRTYGGEPFALDAHMARLARSAERVFIAMPVPPAAFAMEIRLAVRAARNPESYARAMLTRGSGPVGLDPSLAGAPLRVVLVEPLAPLPAAVYREGVGVVLVRTQRAADSAAQGAKVGNYLASLLALKQAREAGAHEALVLDAAGRVVEGTTSNVFLVQGGAIVTPPVEAGILPGITRAHLLEVAAELGRAVRCEAITPADVLAASEVFLSSTLREVVPVVTVDGRPVGGGAPGPVTRALHAAFRTRIGLGGEPMPWEAGATAP
jgi:branched-chain amino acid aminotransferase